MLVGVALAMAAVAGAGYVGIQRSLSAAPEAAFDVARRWQPVGGPAWIAAAQRSLNALEEPGVRSRILSELGRHYPLAPGLWLGRARLARADGDTEAVGERLRLAVTLQPGDADLHWDAAMLSLRSGQVDEAVGYLRDYVHLRPRDVANAVLSARRWVAGPGAVVDRVVGEHVPALERLLAQAARWRDWPLAAAVWERLPPGRRGDEAIAAEYAGRLLRDRRVAEAVRVWRAAEPGFAAGAVSNGGFESPLAGRVPFDWQVRAPEGVRVERDDGEATSGEAALRLAFDGEHNLRLRTPRQYVVVTPGEEYRLTGQWRSDGLTTRSLPYWRVIGEGADRREGLARIEAPRYGSWDWQPFSATFTVPEGMELIRVELRRDPTDNLDRFIGGDLYLDDIALEP
ncbi:MAG: hypothetical protein U5L11_03675 [Arhodomonas sp.]|nr:hypothetical protein [Arhodomonas sp.]